MSRDIALPDHIKRGIIYSGMNPTWGPMILVAAQSSDVVSALRTVDHRLPLKTTASCVFLGGACCHMCATRRRMAD